jgi:heat shock protein HslJ
MRRSIVMLAFALGCDSNQSWFEEKAYLLESMEGREVAAGARIRLHFYGREFSAYGGCQGMSAEYWCANGKVFVGDEHAESDIGVSCGDARNEQSEWMKSFMRATPAYEVDGPRLILSDDDVTIVLLDEEIADPDRPLVGTVWAIDGLVANGVVRGVEGGTLTFGADGRLAIEGPCAAGAADYAADEHFVMLEDVAIDPPQCPGDELGQAFDEHLREFLVAGPLVWEVDDTRLVLGDSDLGLSARSE